MKSSSKVTDSGITAGGQKFRTRSGWKLNKDTDCTQIEGESLTVQNQSKSIRDLLRKHANGLLITNEYPSIEVGEVDYDSPDFEKSAQADIHERELMTKIAYAKAKQVEEKLTAYKKEQSEKHKRLSEEAREKEISEYLAKQAQSQQSTKTQ